MLLISQIRKQSKPVIPKMAVSTPALHENPKENRLENILSFLEAHICEQLTVTDICSAFALSRSALQSLFHEKKNCGVMDYFNHMKIERAKEMIRNGNMNVTEISCFLSYSSLQYFSKQFRKITGMSPTEYCSSVKGLSEAVN